MKKDLNPIPPTLRGKKRYIKFRVFTQKNLRENDVKYSLFGVFSRLFGASGVAEQKLWLIKWFPEKNEGIVRCSHLEEENVKAGLLFLSEIADEKAVPMVVSVSGSIKKLK